MKKEYLSELDFNINQKDNNRNELDNKNFNPLKKKKVKHVSVEEIGSEACCKKPSIIKKAIKECSKVKSKKDYSLIDEI